MTRSITIRYSSPDDRAATHRLAALDARVAPAGTILLAFADDQLRAALPLDGGEPLADPFHPTAELVTLLRLRHSSLHRRHPRRRWPPRIRPALNSD